jgi:sulfoxide reductase heme-binding subunit YedZ
MSEQLWWYVARSGGIVALVLAGLSVAWGLLISTKIMGGRPKPKWLLDLHRFLGGATVVFAGIHVGALMLDSYVHFGWTDVLIPFASAWNPAAVAMGIVAMYLLIAVEVTSLFMRKIPRKWWKIVHLSSYGLFWAGLIHGLTAGTDASNPIYVATAAVSILAVLFLTIYRVLDQRKLRTKPRLGSTGPLAKVT